MTTLTRTSTLNRKFPVETLTSAEVRKLVMKCSPSAATGIRNRALLITLWRCGLRISEALALYPKDIDAKEGTIRVLHGKGDKCRVVGIDPQALAVIEKWLDKRKSLDINGHHRLFCTLKGKPVQTVYVRNMMKSKARKAGIEKRVHPHGLRHSCASDLRQEGVDIGVISKQLGHSSIATTAHYLDHILPKTVIEAMQGRAW